MTLVPMPRPSWERLSLLVEDNRQVWRYTEPHCPRVASLVKTAGDIVRVFPRHHSVSGNATYPAYGIASGVSRAGPMTHDAISFDLDRLLGLPT